MGKYVPDPWDEYGPPQPRDVDLPPDELDEAWRCEFHDGEHRSRRLCAEQLEKDVIEARQDARYAREDLDEAEARLDEISEALYALRPFLPGEAEKRPVRAA